MRVPPFLTRNLGLKALATGLALVIWAAVVYAGNPPQSRSVTVHVPQDPAALPSRYILAHPVGDLVVRVSGTQDHVNAFNPNSLTVKANWSHIHAAGVQDVPVTIGNADPNVDLDNPPTLVSADVDIKASQTVDVHVSLFPPLPAGYEAAGTAVTPPQVVVAGPERELQGLRAMVILDFSNRRTNYTADRKVVMYDANNHIVGDVLVDPPTVTVSVTVRAVTTTRTVAIVPKITGNVAPGHALSAITMLVPDVVLTGPEDILNTVDSVTTSPIIINGLFADHTFTVPLVLPQGIKAEPSSATITFHVVTLATPTPFPTPTPTPTPVPTPRPSPTPSPTP